ncbi:hypothetical protein [Streptomyces sp. NPDC046161]|uniref:hypothetical protein n=1 Tax=Streptomyces sp. NPDC046161 TaxID=3155132 RepID=UPI0033D65586
MAWLLTHDKIEVPVAMPEASLLVTGATGWPASFRLDGPHLVLADGAEGRTSCPAGLPKTTPTRWPSWRPARAGRR